MQGEVDTDGIESKFDPAVAGLVDHAGLEKCVHVRVHRLTSRPARRAASRIVIGPCPAKTLSNSQRFAVRTFHSNSGVAKLIRACCFLPLKAASARRVTSSRDATSRVTVFIFGASNSSEVVSKLTMWGLTLTYRSEIPKRVSRRSKL